MIVANRLREVRTCKGITQLELGRLTRIAPSAISSIENGKVYAFKGWRKRLAKALGVQENEIFPE